MAHWIVDDHGFGGVYYRCSECGESWCNIYSDVSSGDKTCPNCGAAMDEDETEYIEEKKKGFRFSDIFSGYTRKKSDLIRYYDEKNTTLRQLTGYDIEKLIELFAAGYTLEPPKYSTFDELLKETE